MEDFILGALGVYTTPVLLVSLLAVIVARRRIRKRHIVILLVLTVLGFIGFFALLLWGFTWYHGQESVVIFQATLRLIAAVTVGCGAAIGYSMSLKLFGLASLEEPVPPQRRRSRTD